MDTCGAEYRLVIVKVLGQSSVSVRHSKYRTVRVIGTESGSMQIVFMVTRKINFDFAVEDSSQKFMSEFSLGCFLVTVLLQPEKDIKKCYCNSLLVVKKDTTRWVQPTPVLCLFLSLTPDQINMSSKSKVCDRSQGRPKGSLFNSYYTKMQGRALLLSVDCSTLPLKRTLYCWVLNKKVSSTIFKVFDMTRPGIEPRSSGPLVNPLPTRPCLTGDLFCHSWRLLWMKEKSDTLAEFYLSMAKISLPYERHLFSKYRLQQQQNLRLFLVLVFCQKCLPNWWPL